MTPLPSRATSKPAARFALFLRGINVGGVKIPMAQLRALLTDIGGLSVSTWLASGNAAADWPGTEQELHDAVEAALSQRFGYRARVILRPLDELAAIIADCPHAPTEGFHRYVVLFSSADDAVAAMTTAPVPDLPGEQVHVHGREIYWRCPQGHTTDSAFGKHQNRGPAEHRPTVRNLQTLQRMAG